MKSLLEELKEHQDKIEGQQEKSLAGFSDQITEMSADVAATMDGIADLYEHIMTLEEQMADLQAQASETESTDDSTAASTTEGGDAAASEEETAEADTTAGEETAS